MQQDYTYTTQSGLQSSTRLLQKLQRSLRSFHSHDRVEDHKSKTTAAESASPHLTVSTSPGTVNKYMSRLHQPPAKSKFTVVSWG
jgi:hypothetical protein